MNEKYWLITDAAPPEVEAKTGLRGLPTPLGTLVEARSRHPSVDYLMEQWNRALNPRRCYCAVVHMPPCPFAYMMT